MFNNLNKLFYFIISPFIIIGCSTIDESLPFAYVEVIKQGMHNSDRPEMASTCNGFILSPEKITAFYNHAAPVDQMESREKYHSLPCFSYGTAFIYGEKYEWTIRAGGVGEFYNDKKRLIKICGVKCCDKVRGVC